MGQVMKPKSFINDISINSKLIFVAIIGAVLPVILLLAIYTIQLNRGYKEKEEEISNALVNAVTNNVVNYFESVQNVSFSYSGNIDLTRMLIPNSDFTEEDRLLFFENLEGQIRVNMLGKQNIKRINIYYNTGEVPYEGHYVKGIEQINTSAWTQANGLLPPYLFLTTEIDDGDVVIGLGKTVNGLRYNSQNLVHILMEGSDLSGLLKESMLDAIEGDIYLVDEKGNVVASTNEIYSKGISTFVAFDDLEQPSDTKVISTQIGNQFYLKKWSLIFVINEGMLHDSFIDQVLLIFLIALFIIMVVYLSHYQLTKSIVKRLQTINSSMEMAESEVFQIIEAPMGNDEIGQTARHFNKMIQRIHGFVYKDILTDLMNRQAIVEAIDEAIEENVSNNSVGTTIGVLFLDVDNFKFINDTYGHELGDEVIRKTSFRIQDVIGELGEVGRFGGDEFIILLKNGPDARYFKNIAKRICNSFNGAIEIMGMNLYLTVSVGIALGPDHGNNSQELIKKADLALYEAKDAGKNQAKVYNGKMDENLIGKIAFQNAIKDAFGDGDFYMDYQPYFGHDRQDLLGFEALIRWYSEDYGQVSPFRLIQTVESMGLIVDVGRWVLESALTFTKEINRKSLKPVTVSINISAIQLMQPEFFEEMIEAVRRHEVDPSLVILEMTETVLINSIEISNAVLGKLRQVGFGIAIDDFGTGYSSLSYMQTLPATHLKIDRHFIARINNNDIDRQLVKIITELAHQLNMKVVAEGVEDEKQLETAITCACDIIQGYYYSRPIGESDAKKMIINKKEQPVRIARKR